MDTRYKIFCKMLREGVQTIDYGYDAGVPDTYMAECHMCDAADLIKELAEENEELRQKLNKRQKLINTFFNNWPLEANWSVNFYQQR